MALCIGNLRQSIWFDESYSAYLTHYDYGKVWDLTAQDVHPPLYYFVLKTWAHFFGHTDVAMRMLSVVFGAIAILFAYLWLKYKYGATAAITATTLLVISPIFIRYGQEMRMYTMVLAIVFVATYVLQLAIDNGRKRWWIIYALLLAAGMWTHYFCALAWFAHLIYLVFVYKKKIFQKKIILTYVFAVLLFLPWMPSLITQTGAVQNGFWIAPVSVKRVADYFTEAFLYRESGDVAGWFLPLFFVVFIALIIFAVRARKKMHMLMSLALVPVLALIAVSMPPLSSMFIPRYILFSIAAISMIAGVSIVLYLRSPRKTRAKKIMRNRKIAVAFTVVLLVTSSVCGIVTIYTRGNYNFDTDTKSASRELFETISMFNSGQNLPIICASEWQYYDMSFYSTRDNPIYFMNETTDYKYGSLYPLRDSYFGRIDNLDAFLETHDDVWYVTSIDRETNEWTTTFPRENWRISEFTKLHLNDHSDTYIVAKMSKE